MLFGETVAVCYENHMEHINALCEQSADFHDGTAGGVHSNHRILTHAKLRGELIKLKSGLFIVLIWMNKLATNASLGKLKSLFQYTEIANAVFESWAIQGQ
jgi:hypothetical protein